MGDVTITSNSSGELLKWNGSAWVNNTLAEAGILPVANPTFTGNLIVGSATVTEAQLEILDGATVTTAELNKLDGASANVTAANLNILTDSSSTTALHAHAGGGPSQANQSAIEAETNQDTYLPPDLVKNSPGVAKVWVKMNSAGSNIVSYNVYATGQDSTGTFAVTIAIDFSSNSYVGLAQGEGGGDYPASIGNLVAGSYKVYTFSGGSLSNNTNDSAAWGTQV